MKPGLPLIVLLLGSTAPAFAMDCARAELPVEKAICADAQLLAIDQQIEEAYQALASARDDAGKAALQGSQKDWLAERDRGATTYLATYMNHRLFYLTGRAFAGPGAASRIVPLIHWQDVAGKPTLKIKALSFATPRSAGEWRFNELMNKQVADVVYHTGDEPGSTVEMSASLIYASARFISVHLGIGEMIQGAAHPNSRSHVVNVDLARRGRELSFTNLFHKETAPKIASLCRPQVLVQKKERDAEPEDEAELKQFDEHLNEVVPNLRRWSFAADKVHITFDSYVLGSYLEGPYSCELPYSALRPLARPDAWLVD